MLPTKLADDLGTLSIHRPKSSFLPAGSAKYFNTIHAKKNCVLLQVWKQTQSVRGEFLLLLKQEKKSVSKQADVRVEGCDFLLAFKNSLLL